LSLASYWMLFVGVALAVLVLLTIFSKLVMAHWQEEDQDRLEINLLQEKISPAYLESAENLMSPGTSSIARSSQR
jgi:hypothetical protein